MSKDTIPMLSIPNAYSTSPTNIARIKVLNLIDIYAMYRLSEVIISRIIGTILEELIQPTILKC